MGSFNVAIFLCVLGLVIMGHVSYAQDSPQDFLDAHNAERSLLGVPPLQWNDALAAYAKNYSEQHKIDCELMHSNSESYGENLAGSTGDLSAIDAVKLWVDEKSCYNYESNTCEGGECLHYTQVVWRNTQCVGCAKVRCDNGGTFISCNYDPPGNYVGEKPY